jgi:hypothetical protein
MLLSGMLSKVPISLIAAIVAFGLVLGLLLGPGQSTALAEQVNSKQSPQAPAKAQVAGQKIPDDQHLIVLITSTLLALNQANLTGNYSVFRELGAPGFQLSNSAGKLSDAFADLRQRNFDLSPIAVLQPSLVRRPEITSNGMLRLSGFFPTVPERLNFDLIYQRVDDRWLLFGIAANTTPIRPAQAQIDRRQENPAANISKRKRKR